MNINNNIMDKDLLFIIVFWVSLLINILFLVGVLKL